MSDTINPRRPTPVGIQGFLSRIDELGQELAAMTAERDAAIRLAHDRQIQQNAWASLSAELSIARTEANNLADVVRVVNEQLAAMTDERNLWKARTEKAEDAAAEALIAQKADAKDWADEVASLREQVRRLIKRAAELEAERDAALARERAYCSLFEKERNAVKTAELLASAQNKYIAELQVERNEALARVAELEDALRRTAEQLDLANKDALGLEAERDALRGLVDESIEHASWLEAYAGELPFDSGFVTGVQDYITRAKGAIQPKREDDAQ